MSYKRTLLSLAVAAGLGAASLQANAATATVYGDVALALVYLDSNANGGGTASTSYSLQDNVSIFGVKGDVAKIGGTTFFYDLNWILGDSNPARHLSIVGMKGGYGTVTTGLRDNGLFESMVDGGTYQQNWFYTPGMSALQVSNAITYKSMPMGGLTLGVQAFDFGKESNGNSTTNFTVAGSYATGPMTFGAGYTNYADNSPAADTDQSGAPTNTFSGVQIDKTKGISFAYAGSNWNVTAAYDVRTPYAGDDFKTLMVTGAYSFGKSTVGANVSSTSGYAKGEVTTLIYSYAPADALYYSVEYQNSNADANANGISYATGGTGTSSSIVLGVTYNF